MNKFVFAMALFCAGWGVEPPLVDQREKGPSFTYLSFGVTGSPALREELAGADPFIGRREFFTEVHVMDVGIGAWLPFKRDVWMRNLYYAQGSYLHYFLGSEGPYLGAGLTIGMNENRMFWANLPVTFGYHYRAKSNVSSFLQLQASPIFTPYFGTATISYGVGF